MEIKLSNLDVAVNLSQQNKNGYLCWNVDRKEKEGKKALKL